jgi:hypothetical protein
MIAAPTTHTAFASPAGSKLSLCAIGHAATTNAAPSKQLLTAFLSQAIVN